MYGLTPPLALAVAEPLLPPLHKTLFDDMDTEGPPILLINTAMGLAHPFESVTVTW